MRIAKTKSEIEQIRKKLEKLGHPGHPIKKHDGFSKGTIEDEINSYYVELEKSPTDNYLSEAGFKKWIAFPQSQLPQNYEEARAKYEAFIGGYLYYFEKNVSHLKNDNRTLYFDWGVINKEHGLTVFLNPLYSKKINTVISNAGSGNVKHNGSKNGKEELNVQKNKSAGKIRRTAIAPPPAMPIDPPPPPPPPPPDRG